MAKRKLAKAETLGNAFGGAERYPSWALRPWLAVLVLALLPVSGGAAGVRWLGDLPGGQAVSTAEGVSEDGSVVAGWSEVDDHPYNEAFRWTEPTAMEGLGYLFDTPGSASAATGVSGDGAVIVGRSIHPPLGLEFQSWAVRWTAATGMEALGDLSVGLFATRAMGASYDGSVIVGSGFSAASGTMSEAFRWTAATGPVGLGDLPGADFFSAANAVSDDGSVVVGRSFSADADGFNQSEAFRWTAATDMVGLGDFPGDDWRSSALGVSGDGSVVVGFAGVFLEGEFQERAFRWDESQGMQDLGPVLAGPGYDRARDASFDGNLIVGSGHGVAFLWDRFRGMRDLNDVLVRWHQNEFIVLERLVSANAISPDGRFIVGWGRRGSSPYGQAFLAQLPEILTIPPGELVEVPEVWFDLPWPHPGVLFPEVLVENVLERDLVARATAGEIEEYLELPEGSLDFDLPGSENPVWEIRFGGEFTGPARVTFQYDEASLLPETNEAALALYQYVAPVPGTACGDLAPCGWVELPAVEHDAAENTIVVETESFGPFVLGLEPNVPPDCSETSAVPAELWPPNHRFRDVAVAGVTDANGDPVSLTITSIYQDEPVDGRGDGSTSPDGAGVGTATASVRAERSGKGDGRVYHVGFSAEDARGGACSGAVTVCVPHDRRRGGECGDQGPLFDSTVTEKKPKKKGGKGR